MNSRAITVSTPGNVPAALPQYDFGADFELGQPAARFDLAAIWAVIVRNRWLIGAIVLLALALGVASILLAKPVYRAEASIQIEPQALRILGTQDVAPDPSKTEADRALQTQVDVLKSRATAQSVATRLNLVSNRAFLSDAGLLSAPRDGLQNQVTSVLQANMGVSSPTATRVIKISYDSHDPQLAALIANNVAQAFIADTLQRRVDTYSYSREFLQKQLQNTKGRLEASERALISYSQSAGLVDAAGAAGGPTSDGERRSLTTASLVDLNSAYSQARATRVQAQQRWQQAISTPLMSLPEVLSNPTVQNLTEKRADLEAALQEERQRRKEDHPAIKQAAARLSEMDRQIGTLAAGIRASIGDQYRVAQRQENALLSNVGQLKAASFDEQSKGVRYNILKREADTNRNLYNSLLQRFNEVSSQAADTNNTISIIDRAMPPASAVYPRPAINLALSGLAGLLLALGVAFGRTKFDDRVHGPNDVERDFGVPVLGVVPLLKGPGSIQQALDDPRSNMAEAHHAIGLALDSIAHVPDHPVLLLTSSLPDEGKSTSAVQLCSHFASADKRVLLVDGDMRRGTVHQLLGVANDTGLADLLDKNSPKEDPLGSVQFCERHGFDFLARGRSLASPAELLAGDRIAEVLKRLSTRYDVIIIDGPPVMGLVDAPRLGSLADATLFIMAAGRAQRAFTRIALKRLADAGADRIGVVVSKYDPANDRGGYGYAYRYDYGQDGDARSARPFAAAETEEEDVLELMA
jgi:polysaccharide biosynthesis transport protein